MVPVKRFQSLYSTSQLLKFLFKLKRTLDNLLNFEYVAGVELELLSFVGEFWITNCTDEATSWFP